MSDIRLVVFNNGLQVIADLTEKDTTTGTVTLGHPVQLVTVPMSPADQKEGKAGMAFAPFLRYSEEWDTGLTFFSRDILTVATPIRDLSNAYTAQFGSGIVLPTGLHSV